MSQVSTPASAVTPIVERLNAEILNCAAHLASQLPAFDRQQKSVGHSTSALSSSGDSNSSILSKAPYAGPQRKLVVGIDVGTTFSGVSYCVLDPGVVPLVQGVNRYPAHSKVGGDAKIPSIIYYDASGSVRAVEAEALLESNIGMAADQQWVKVEWFKLHLRTSPGPEPIPPIPQNKTIVQVFGDFLRYLHQCTRAYIEDTHADGPELWKSVEGHGEFILTHPNGWRGPQIAKMRAAAIYAGLVPDNLEGHARIRFMTEDMIKSGEGVLIVDAGGGTIDLSAYRMTETQNCFEEISRGSCHFQGSTFVSRRVLAFLKGKLSSSRYDTPEDIQHISECFDKSTKLSFKDPTLPSFIKFGTPRETDSSVDVKFGQLKLSGPDMVTFFEPNILTIQDAIKRQMDTSSARIAAVLMVGGFAASDWLFSNLQTYLQGQGIRFVRPDSHLGKAVVDGAVLSAVDQSVSVRASASAGCYEKITPWIGDALARLLEDARDAKDPSMVVRVAVETFLINYSRHLARGGDGNEDICQTLLMSEPKTGTQTVNADSFPRIVMDKLSAILLLAGYSNRHCEAITDSLSGDVKSFMNSILELRGIVDEPASRTSRTQVEHTGQAPILEDDSKSREEAHEVDLNASDSSPPSQLAVIHDNPKTATVEELEGHVASLRNENNAHRDQLENEHQARVKLEAVLKTAEKRIKSLEAQTQHATQKSQLKTATVEELKGQVACLRKENNAHKDQLEIEHQVRVKLEAGLKTAEKRIKSLEAQTQHAPQKSQLKTATVEELKGQVACLRKENNAHKDQLENEHQVRVKLEAVLKTAEKRIKSLEAQTQHVPQKSQLKTATVEELKGQVACLRKENNAHKDQLEIEHQVRVKLEAGLKTAEKRIKSLEAQTQHAPQKSQREADLKSNDDQILQLETQILAKNDEILKIREQLDDLTTIAACGQKEQKEAIIQLSNKCTEQAQELDSMRKKYGDAISNNDRTKYVAALEQYKNRVAQLSAENESYRRGWHEMNTKAEFSDKYKNRAAVREAEKAQLQEALAHMESVKDHYVESARQMRNEANSAVWDLQALQRTYAETIALLDARTKELTVAQQFLTVADSIPSKDVIKLAAKLNAEISQCAASLADRLSTLPSAPASDDIQSPIVGPTAFPSWEQNGVSKLLDVARAIEDPTMAVQTAIQACLVSISAQVINVWYPDDHVESMFQRLYKILRQAVAPPIAGRWRALTKSNLDELHDSSYPNVLPVALRELVNSHVESILVITGYRKLPTNLSNHLNRNLSSIIQCLLELRSAIREKTFYELEAFVQHCGTPFDPTSMVDSFNSPENSTGEIMGNMLILCTTDLGLRRSEAKVANVTNIEQETEFVEDVLLMPKVALQSVLDDFLGVSS